MIEAPSKHPRPERAGFSLVELMVTLIILALIMGTTVLFFQHQNRSFLQASEKMDLLQNARYAVSEVERVLRTLGTGVTGQQPMLVYGDESVVAFNTDYAEVDTTNYRWAVYFNPSVSGTDAEAWQEAAASVIPNSSPAYTYPSRTFTLPNGAPSPAETKIFWFAPDSSTGRADDFVLFERTNNGRTDLIARNILEYPGRPFLEFFFARKQVGFGDTLMIATGSLLPLKRVQILPGFSTTDSANAVRPDSVRSVRINLQVTNGRTGPDERTRLFSQAIQLPNNGLPSPNVCGRPPLPVTSFSATPSATPGSGVINLRWTRSPDDNSGEYDVRQYILFQREDAVPIWRDPLMILRADTTSVYDVAIGGLVPGQAYDFAVAAQDCTPAASSMLIMTQTAP